MSSTKPRQSLADYVTIALSPLLIMALVGSLVFFLLEILYVGQYSGRLQWTLFCFVFAMVLIARISIEQGYERAGLYGIALAVAVFLALLAASTSLCTFAAQDKSATVVTTFSGQIDVSTSTYTTHSTW